MKSPFPGMDPYLEQYWRDVHHSLCTYARDALQPQVRPAMIARVDERLVVETADGDLRSIYPDVKVVERTRGQPAGADIGVAVAEPLVVSRVVESEPATEGFIQIIDTTTGGRLVTVIEFLSLSNKLPGPGQEQYRQKQRELREAGVNLVEVDLLRAGDWVLQAPRDRIPVKHRTSYRACVYRASKPDKFEFYSFAINDALPAFRIPLREQDKDATLNLQALIDLTYHNGAYDFIDYGKPPVPPLEAEAAAWADEVLRVARKR
jgi:hypothetical protein